MGWKHPFRDYAEMYDYVSGGRSPHREGRKFTSAFRLFLRDDHIEIHNHSLKLAKLYSDDTLEFVATPNQVWSAGNSLAMNFTKVLPVAFHNIDKGRYKIISPLKSAIWQRDTQEYFQGLILNLKTGEVINPKDMTPVTDEDKRKQWLAGLKSFRLTLRAMARVGVFDAKKDDAPRYSPYFSSDDLCDLANAIMTGEVSEDIARMLRYKTSEWATRKYSSYGEAVVGVFENAVKSNSRRLRTFVGVISLKD
jgi:hypothetical protein